MKKIALAFDGLHFPEGAFAFIRYLHALRPLMVTGSFVPLIDFAHMWSYASGTSGSLTIPLVEDEHAEKVNHNIQDFKNRCINSDIPYQVHKNFYGLAVQELVGETRFSDVLLLGMDAFYQNLGDEMNDYFKEILHKSECPVMVYPNEFEAPKSLVLAYDGSSSSVGAIKQFAYLFSELKALPTVLLYVAGKEEESIPDDSQVEDLVGMHYPNFKVQRLVVQRDDFTHWLEGKEQSILVSGAYGRSYVSQLFKKSFVRDILVSHQLPVFIAHK
jgi:hypothetical protein